MNIGTGDYYSIDGSGYTKYANVEVIGIDPRQINNFKTHPDTSHRSPDKEVQQESVIKQEDIEYDPQQARYAFQKDVNQPRQIIQKSEVNSVHMSIGNKISSANLTYSGYDKNTTPYKGILKRSMQQLEKNMSSQDDSAQYRQLCLQLDKQKKMRKELQQSYKNLLSKIHKNQRSQTQLHIQQGSTNQNRQFYAKTLKHSKGKRQPIQSCQQFSSVIDKNDSKSQIKTVKKLQVPKSQKLQLLQNQQLEDNNEDYIQNQDQTPNEDQKYSKNQQNQSQEQEQNQYFIEDRQFQAKVLFDLNNLSRKITDIDNFLIESEQIRERDRLNKIIQQKQTQIRRIQLQNELLKRGSESNQPNQENSSSKIQNKMSINNLQNIVNNMTPTTLYVLAILLMAIVAIAS